MGGSDVSPALALRVGLAGAWHVVRGRSLAQFPRVLGLLEAVGRAAPRAVRYRHGARLRLGLRAAAVIHMLQDAQPDGKIFDAVDTFFPEGEGPLAGLGRATPQELAMVGEAQETFRELILGLLGDPQRRAAYLQGPVEREYGEPFLAALERLFHEYLGRLESALPRPVPRELHSVVWSHAPSQLRPRDLPILNRYLSDMAHVHCGQVSRPLRVPAKPSTWTRPGYRRLRPLKALPFELPSDFSSEEEAGPSKKARSPPLSGESPPS